MPDYGDDLAFIHDRGYCELAMRAADTLIAALAAAGHDRGRVVELGCGSGASAQRLAEAGYDVLGIDISSAMIELARQRVPAAEFVVGSFVDVVFPPCVAVTAIGEVLSYQFDRGNTTTARLRLFRRIARALVPGGRFLFDVVGPGRVPGGSLRTFASGDTWAVLVDAVEDRSKRQVVREITSFRQVGELYRRSIERHVQSTTTRAEMNELLRRAGLAPQSLNGYGGAPLRRGQLACLATRKAPALHREA